MDLICPNCQKRLSLEDKFAGLTVRCPLCNGMFQAPALAPSAPSVPPGPPVSAAEPAPVPASPPPVPREPTILLTPSEPAPSTMPALEIPDSAPARPPVPPPYEPEVEPEPIETTAVPPGEYTRSFIVHLRTGVLSWFPPVCVTLLFVLSLLPWYWTELFAANLWQLAFTTGTVNMYTFYVIVVVFIAWPLSILVFLLEQHWIPLPAALRPLWSWRSVFVGMAILLPFVFFLGDYVLSMFRQFGNPATIAMKLAVRVHFLAVVACCFQFWLEQRRSRNLPPPRMEMRW